MNDNTVSIRVWGDFACFTRPEMKVERVSYPIITPSAARGIFEAVFWEPQVFYIIDAVRVVNKGRWVSFRRNEVTAQVSINSAGSWMREPSRFSPIQAGGGAADGTQRNMLALAGVEYILTAQVGLTELGRAGRHNLKTYRDEIERRAKKGKCFHRPALGVREFAADFDWEPDPQAALERRIAEIKPDGDWRHVWPEEDLGFMLYDVFDHRQREAGFRWLTDAERRALAAAVVDESESKKGKKKTPAAAVPRSEGTLVRPQAAFFQACVRESRMDCHPGRVKMITKPVEGGYAA
ncbi:type I-C CRISPR-associated protein Cas5c [Desulfurivibrio sp. D14AmB]|uniref:type I-C CRISPR-associated protein Cas5c n=1 Tax=Desulfurivibrio sp. D14AmB TaxID=3374370 RepID=UPI00376F2D97